MMCITIKFTVNRHLSTNEKSKQTNLIFFINFKSLCVFPDYLVATAVVVSVWSWYNFSPCIDIVLIFFHTA